MNDISWCQLGTQIVEYRNAGDPLDRLAAVLTELAKTYPKAGMIGYLAYETGCSWVGLPVRWERSSSMPLPHIQFLFYEHLSRSTTRTWNSPYHGTAVGYDPSALKELLRRKTIHPRTSRAAYLQAVSEIKRHIETGDIYQANLTQAFDVTTSLSGREIYSQLADQNPAPFSAYMRFAPVTIHDVRNHDAICFPALEIISNSPERFWKKEGQTIETRPIKGTIGRSADAGVDRKQRRRLMRSSKDRAELLMITDLERNDLGRCARIGSVRTLALRRLRAAASVWHMESVVTAEVNRSTGWNDIMRAMFPSGSITGAPKRRAMEILFELETIPRGVYCGAFGWVDAKGDADFAIGIRTATKIGTTVRVCGGGGIVADSDPDAEYLESLIKIAPMLDCLSQSPPNHNTAKDTDSDYTASISIG